jgi:hypothetical protein
MSEGHEFKSISSGWRSPRSKLRRIGRKLGVGSAELSVTTPGRRPEIGVFGLFLKINVTVWRILYSLPIFSSNKCYSSANFIQFNKTSK